MVSRRTPLHASKMPWYNDPRIVGFVASGVYLVAATSFYTVYGGERVVIFNKLSGIQKNVVGEGLHFKLPFIQEPQRFDVRTRPRMIPTITGTKDLQNVNLTIRVLFRPEIKELCNIYRNLGLDYEERILPSITSEVLKSVVAQFDAAELITQREMVSREIRKNLGERAKTYGIILDDISITHLAFSKEFMGAVEMKQVAQQEAERARYLVEKAEHEKNAAVLSSEGDALAAELLAKAFSKAGDSLITLRRLEAAEEIANTLSQSPNVSYLPGGQNVLLNLRTPQPH